MARTACSEVCLAVYLHEKSFSVPRALDAHAMAPCLRVEQRGPAAKVSWVIFCSGRLLGCCEIQDGHKQLGMERTATSSLVPFQPFQPGRNKLRHVLSLVTSCRFLAPDPLASLLLFSPRSSAQMLSCKFSKTKKSKAQIVTSTTSTW